MHALVGMLEISRKEFNRNLKGLTVYKTATDSRFTKSAGGK